MCEFRVKYCYSNKSWSVVFSGQMRGRGLFSFQLHSASCDVLFHTQTAPVRLYTLLAKSITSASEIFLLTYIFYVKQHQGSIQLERKQWGNRAIIPLVQFSLDRNLMFIIHISIVIVYILYNTYQHTPFMLELTRAIVLIYEQ